MAIETERRFRIKTNAWLRDLDVTDHVFIEQGYVAVTPENVVVRVRRAGDRGFLTVKTPTGSVGSANEFEYEIPIADASSLLASCKNKIQKMRYTIHVDEDLCWEIDQFFGANDGLILAEIELPSLDTPIALPSWVGDAITGDHSYANSRLAVDPKTDHHLLFPWETVMG